MCVLSLSIYMYLSLSLRSSRLSIRTLSRGSRHSSINTPLTTAAPSPGPPVVEEETHDKMRAGFISKAIDHITLLIEEWFIGTYIYYDNIRVMRLHCLLQVLNHAPI